jgi:hypothetical protein
MVEPEASLMVKEDPSVLTDRFNGGGQGYQQLRVLSSTFDEVVVGPAPSTFSGDASNNLNFILSFLRR